MTSNDALDQLYDVISALMDHGRDLGYIQDEVERVYDQHKAYMAIKRTQQA